MALFNGCMILQIQKKYILPKNNSLLTSDLAEQFIWYLTMAGVENCLDLPRAILG